MKMIHALGCSLLWLANCYFAHNSSRFPVLLPTATTRSSRGRRKIPNACSLA
jgi:hypothetical protein